jgi:hypothetical protein
VGVGFTRNRRSNPLASDSAHIYSPPAIRSTPVNSQIKVPQGIPGVQSNLYGASRETSSHRGGSSQHSENYIPNQHNINRTNPSVSSPSRNISTSQPAYTSPRSNSNVNRFYTPSDNNRLQSGSSRSFNNGFNGGSNSIGHTSGTNGIRSSSSNSSQRVGFSSGNSGNFGGGHRGR